MKQKKKLFGFLLMIAVLLVSCKEKLIDDKDTAGITANKAINEYKYITGVGIEDGKKLKVGVPVNYSPNSAPYYNDFDVENAQPLVVTYKGVSRTIYFPFEDGAVSTYMDLNTRHDVKRADGWELLYNWFPTHGGELQIPCILLYNRYRGVMKLFYLHVNDNLTTGGNVVAALGIIGKKTKLFNNTLTVTSPDSTIAFCSVSQSSIDNINGMYQGLQDNRWYAFEWDASYYDPNVSYTDQFAILGAGMNLSTIALQGNITGGITGKLVATKTTTSDNSLVSTSDIKSAINDGTKSVVSGFYKDQIGPKFAALKNKTTNSFLKKIFGELALSSTATSIGSLIAGPVSSFLASPISKLLGKIFPGKTSTQEETTMVNLKANLTASFQGTIEGSQSILGYQVVVPNIRSEYNGTIYNHYGVFSLNRNPKLGARWDFTYIAGDWGDWEMLKNPANYVYTEIFDFKDNLSDLITINPALLEEADVTYDWKIVSYIPSRSAYLYSTEYYNYHPGTPGVSINETNIENSYCIQELYQMMPEVYPREYSDEKYFSRAECAPASTATISTPITYTSTPWEEIQRMKMSYNPNGYNPGSFPNYPGYTMEIKVLVTVKVAPRNGSTPVVISQLFQPNITVEQIYFPRVIVVSTSGI